MLMTPKIAVKSRKHSPLPIFHFDATAQYTRFTGEGVMVHVMYERSMNPAASAKPAQNMQDVYYLDVLTCQFTF